MSKATQKALSELHGEFARKLKDILHAPVPEGGEGISASHLNVIRQFLKDNNIDALPDNPDMASLTEGVSRVNLPFTPDQDEYGLPVQ